MKRVLIYSPDALEQDDFRRITTLAQRLLALDTLDLLVLSEATDTAGASAGPVDPGRVDLPSLRAMTLNQATDGSARRMPLCAALARRTEIIQQTLAQFAPDVLIADRLPLGRYDELGTVFKTYGPGRPPQRILLLRDLLDASETTAMQWAARGYFGVIEEHYDRILVLGDLHGIDRDDEPTISHAAVSKIDYCGHPSEAPVRSEPAFVRRGLGVSPTQPLVLVRAGPGRAGEDLIRSLIIGLARLPLRPRTHILCGDGMRESARLALACAAHALPEVSYQHSSRDVLSLIAAADIVVTDASYRSGCEILTQGKPAVVVPSPRGLSDESMRAARLAALGLVRVVAHSEDPDTLAAAILDELMAKPPRAAVPPITPPAWNHAPARTHASPVHP